MFNDLPTDAKPARIKRRQQQFVRELMERMQKDILNQIKEGKVPDDWDGIELRALVSYHAKQSAYIMDEKHNRRRSRDFRNVVLTNNL